MGLQLKKQKGFTLIELMMVIIVLGILVAIALPNFIGASNRAKVAALKQNVATFQNLLEAYQVDMGTYPVYIQDLSSQVSYNRELNKLVNPFHSGSLTTGATAGDTTVYCHLAGAVCGTEPYSRILSIQTTTHGYQWVKSTGLGATSSFGSIVYFTMGAGSSWAGTSTWNPNTAKHPILAYGIFAVDGSGKTIPATIREQGTPIL